MPERLHSSRFAVVEEPSIALSSVYCNGSSANPRLKRRVGKIKNKRLHAGWKPGGRAVIANEEWIRHHEERRIDCSVIGMPSAVAPDVHSHDGERSAYLDCEGHLPAHYCVVCRRRDLEGMQRSKSFALKPSQESHQKSKRGLAW